MAHQIETHGDQAAAIFAREHAWHRLGTTLDRAFTAEEAMTQGHLGGWNVRKLALTATELTDDGVTTLEVPGQFATVRTNPFTSGTDFLGTVGNQYTPVQNEEHADILNTLVDESGAHFETAGSLREGREVFLSMKFPEGIQVGGEDPIDLYLTALNSHDGRSAFRLLVTPVRVVCANTQAAALANHKASYSIRHTTGVKGRIQEAREALGMTFAYMDAFGKEAEAMLAASYRPSDFTKAVRDIFPEPATKRGQQSYEEGITTLQWIFNEAPTNEPIRGTRWGAYQAVTEYIDHYMPIRGEDDGTRRAERATGGDAFATKAYAFDLLSV